MKIVLINPYITVYDPAIYLSEPLGLLYLATYLKRVFGGEIEVTILDLYAAGAGQVRCKDGLYILGVNDESFLSAQLNEFKPDLVGITCNFTAYVRDALDIGRCIKRMHPALPVVMGGAHSTIEADSILRENDFVDFVVRGEGEITLEMLIRGLRGDVLLEEIDGLSYRKKADATEGDPLHTHAIRHNPPREFITDLDMLPIPDRSLIDMNYYKSINHKVIWYVRKKPVATIMTTRGCPFHCIFCSTKVVWSRKWRPRSISNVVSEIEALVAEYGIREIVINDDQFMMNKQRVHEFLDYFIQRKLDLSFAIDSGVSTWLIDKDLLLKMKKAGFYSLRFPIETGNEVTLKFIRKPVNLKKTKDLIEMANSLGFWTSANFIIGFPDETREQIMETIRYAYDSGLDFTSFIIAKPNAGSELYDVFRDAGLLEKRVIHGSHFYRSDYDTTTMTAQELNDIVAKASGGWFLHKLFFYMKPRNFVRHFLPKFRSTEDILYFLKMIVVIAQIKIYPHIKKARARRDS